MMSKKDYNRIMELLCLSVIPGMYESIVEGANTKLEELIKHIQEE